jgi:aminoglycoside phosphotransferase (APT) family kinase protein
MFEQFIGTKPVEERHRIDGGALEKFLGFRISAIEQFKGGQSNPTYRLTAADGKKPCMKNNFRWRARMSFARTNR